MQLVGIIAGVQTPTGVGYAEAAHGSPFLAIALPCFNPVHAKVIYVSAAAAGGDGLTWATPKKNYDAKYRVGVDESAYEN